ncbi:unnamed protein product (macronuclear) [Paramecium tetraurelia]|uniref:ABC transporter family protein n=1 Tax=Paramecium tetraurelia TaxID=5888 RepID=A0E6L2_PARTE|nr:uncharacterized protein GSPATT00003794001 [Paramecium tetraurelia]CAK90929.1 unnamed protein product [Paramecium tetraurelia]|eukprot:XP_001458326.1 hypothetical protein (macronuclear) [Paramecium tetraurelia strain d4-2]
MNNAKIDQEEPLLEDKSSRPPGLLSRTLFLYVFPLLRLANKTPLEFNMVKDLQLDDQSESLFNRMNQTFQIYKNNTYPLYKSLFITFKKQFFIVYIIILIWNISLMYGPIMIRQTLSYIDNSEHTLGKSFQWLGIILVVRVFNAISYQNSFYMLRKLGYDQHSAVSVSVMKKTLNVSFQSNKQYKTGEIMNIMQVDLQRILQFNIAVASVIFLPFQIGISFYLLFDFIGISCLAGFGVMILGLLTNFLLGRWGWRLQKQVMVAKDNRTKQAHEIFSQIKFIKANAFEDYFKNKLLRFREKEIQLIKMKNIVSGLFTLAFLMTPQLTLNVTLAVYIWLQYNLTPADTFTIISLFNILQQSASALPSYINQIIEANISIKRIEKFLFTDELMDDCIQNENHGNSIEIEGTFYWDKVKNNYNPSKSTDVMPVNQEIDPILKNIKLKIEIGEFVTIIGDVASGKSSLISAILGEMVYNISRQPPKIKINGNIAYVSQKSWIQNATLKDNILFGLPYDEKRYRDALKYSCLEQDIKILDKGEATMIGEKGVNLSGGQKARITLARALYSDCDIYLLDDLISAVDMHVGKFIIEKCLREYLNGKTIVLITHALYSCQFADRIILMDNGSIIKEGTLEDIKECDKFDQIYQKYFKEQKNEEKDQQDEELEILNLKKKKSSIQQNNAVNKDMVDDLMILEDRKVGSVQLDVYKEYFQMNGGFFFFAFNLIVVITQVIARFGSQIWLAHWSGQDDLSYDENLHNLMIFSFFSLSFGFFAFIRILTLSRESVNTANKVHTRMIEQLLYAPLCQFFERVPLGVLMNRLTKDQSVLDTEILWTISILYISCSNFVASTLINVFSSSYYIILPVLIFLYAVWKVQRFYMAANRELYRLESISKSPILSFFSETVNGLNIIRAFRKQDQFLERHTKNIDLNRKIQVAQLQTTTWFSMNLTFTSFIVNISAIGFVLFFGSENPALAGLLMTVATVIDNSLQSAINSITQAETQFISFERCLAFAKIEHENGYKLKKDYVLNWPQVGDIQIDSLVVKYRENLSPALRGLNVVIKSQEKVGVVGRTGAGKSTVTLSLLRILEASSGSIKIDGVDISTLNLKQLRESITMILQDSTLFEGTLRENLDPLHQHTDQDLNDVALQCCLGDLLLQKKGLDTEISENGDNLSAGEKQLISIARAVLKQSQIILIDEATANIDIDTESKIQQTIQTAFKKCSVITIAHRINTIMHCDKILVIDQGEAKEFDEPQKLLEDKSSIFYGLYMQGKKSNKI